MIPQHSLLPIGILQLWSGWLTPASAQQSFFPSAVPLAVRSPTFSCWLDTRNGSNPMTTWPTFWNHQHILGWAGSIKVDGSTWNWLGDSTSGNASTWINTEITPTRTIITVQAGPMLLNVTFLSPVEPSDWIRQSFPFSYVYVDGKSTDGQSHSIQLYSDISAEWVSNSFATSFTARSSARSNTPYHQVQQSTPGSSFTDVAEDAIAYYAIAGNQPGLVSVIGTDVVLRPQFAVPRMGFNLSSDLAAQFGNVDGDGKFPVLAHAVDLGQTQTISSVAWAVGLVRDPVVTYNGVPRRSYFLSQYSTVGDAIDEFMGDFPDAVSRAIALDQKILQDAGAVSQNYRDLISLATRQAMAGVEITVSVTAAGEWNTSDVQAFMKDVGNTQRVNPTETIYAALPAFMYLNASLTGLLLEPMLRFQNSSEYNNPYAAPDLGTSYPAAPGNPSNNTVYGVENCGNMLILALAHARTSGDGSLISKYYALLKRWAEYLGTNALIPEQQNPADARDPSLAQNHGNITNLALKGIIAMQAMSEISRSLGETADAQKYQANAKTLVQLWVNLTSSSSGLRWTYGDPSSFGLMYNLFADKMLQLNVIPASVYAAESSVLSNNSAPASGFALSTDNTSTGRSDWTLFSAAAAPDTVTRDLLVSAVHKYAGSNTTMGTFPNLYNVQTGTGRWPGVSPNGFASPAQGAMFSILALNIANKTIVIPQVVSSTSPRVSSSHEHTGAIVGGVLGAFAAVILVAGLAIFFCRRGPTDYRRIAPKSPPASNHDKRGRSALISLNE
ncbi:hypothetical protein C8R44DRAFT_719651 [Mycena epipterygia]|nr:hypothetical protein C8R44DRAFT_719651 [Mycena epipterygia]